jgi:tetratricopeptide (TPR) repeat protein
MKQFVVFALSISVVSSSWAQSVDLIYQNNKAVRVFGVEKKLEAYELFLETLILDPYEPTVQFNVGSSLQALGEVEKAEKLYKQLLKDVNAQLTKNLSPVEQQKWLKVKFALLYNLGVHYQGTQKIDEALDSYQQALELIPNSKEIKTNIEMMFTGGGGGKGDGKEKNKDQKDDGKGEQDKKDQGEGDKQEEQKPSDGDRTNEKQKGKEFDQTQMSSEDLRRIMEELKQQEQGIRAKVQRKGEKAEPKDKQW